MAVNPSPWGPCPQFELADGTPAVGCRLFAYVAGSVGTKQNTYTDSTGGVANANPLVLNALGMPTTEWWWTAGQNYKIVYAPPGVDDPPNSPIRTWDNLKGENDVTASLDQWVSGPTPTFVSATSFTLVGDQTSAFHPSRRLKTTNSGGTIYSTILTSTFGAVTTVTVANDSGVLDSGLSAVSYSLISAVNPSINADMVNRKGTAVVSAATTNIWGIAGDYVHVTGATGPITSLGTAPYAGAERIVVFDSTPTLTHNATTLILPGGANIVAAAGDMMIVRADTTANMEVVSYTKANGNPISISTFAATQANQEAATSLVLFASPGTQQFHPSAVQCTLKADAAGNINYSYNVSSIVDLATGQITVNVGTDFSSSNYAITSIVLAAGSSRAVQISSQAAGSFNASCIDATNNTVDPTNWFFICSGDQ